MGKQPAPEPEQKKQTPPPESAKKKTQVQTSAPEPAPKDYPDLVVPQVEILDGPDKGQLLNCKVLDEGKDGLVIEITDGALAKKKGWVGYQFAGVGERHVRGRVTSA